MALQVIGAGYGRTGTKSLQLALEQLGFNDCYHMEALFRNPEGVKHWKDAYDGKIVAWDELFKTYKAAVDFPTSLYYKELADYFPEAKVILTVRDPERWYESVKATIFSFDPGPLIKIKLLLKMPFSAKARNLFKALQLNDKSIWKRKFNGTFKDKPTAIANFNNHINEAKATIPKERLLVFKPQDGWEPLCEFLNVPVPQEPFPNTNAKQNFSAWAKSIVTDVLRSA